MGAKTEADFSGYATKAGLKCSDGRTITPEAFKHMDGMKVPLVWQHGHNSPENILGHVMLEARSDGMYCHAFFNDTKWGKAARELVIHEDIKHLSIYANELIEKVIKGAKQVLHGMICEVSLVLKGANKGALIDYVRIAHSDDPDDIEILEDTAIIHTGLEFESVWSGDEEDDDDLEHGDEDLAHGADSTVQEIVDSMTDEQRAVMNFIVGAALEGQNGTMAQSDNTEGTTSAGSTSADGTTTEGDLTHQEGNTVVTKNLFEQNAGKAAQGGESNALSHAAVKEIFQIFQSEKTTLKDAMKTYALAHGIDNLELLFPDAQAVQNMPEWDKRRTEWVSKVLNGTHKTPFSKIKTLSADITLDAARAKGYVKGNLKKEEFFSISKRTTGATTIYKKQKLDRDDIIDVTDYDIVAWLWGEIRLMLEEELARAILLGDGREVDDQDKIADPSGASSGDGIRSILNDHDYYAMTINVNLEDASSSYLELIDSIISSRRYYKGTGMPTMFTTEVVIAKFLTLRDTQGRRIYRTLDDLAAELRVESIVPVEVMEDQPTVYAILVSLTDYNVGTNKGGEITTFDQFDIDYNQYKYLMETRLSGALTKLKSALIYKQVTNGAGAALVTPNAPTFVSSTGVVTIVATTGVVYKNKETGAVLSTGAQTAIAAGAYITVVATPASSSYYLADNVQDEWKFQRDPA